VTLHRVLHLRVLILKNCEECFSIAPPACRVLYLRSALHNAELAHSFSIAFSKSLTLPYFHHTELPVQQKIEHPTLASSQLRCNVGSTFFSGLRTAVHSFMSCPCPSIGHPPSCLQLGYTLALPSSAPALALALPSGSEFIPKQRRAQMRHIH